MGNYTQPLPLQAIKVGLDKNLPKARCDIDLVWFPYNRVNAIPTLFLCTHVRYNMYFSSISWVVFLHKCDNCFTHFTSFSTAVFPPLAAPPQRSKNHRWISWGFCDCTFHNSERQRTGKKKARHLSHYLVKLDRTGKVHRDSDSF